MKATKNRRVINSIAFVAKQSLQNDRRIFFYSFLRIPSQVLDKLADVYLVAIIVDLVAYGEESRLLYMTLLFTLYKLFSEMFVRYSEWQLSTRNYRSKMKFISGFASKYMKTDFQIHFTLANVGL